MVRSCSRARVFCLGNLGKMMRFVGLSRNMDTGDVILRRNAIFLPVFNIEHKEIFRLVKTHKVCDPLKDLILTLRSPLKLR